ncbi:hypothetical protein DCO17_05240 [Polynucleobacter tropicus]|uniref:Uncharacterized protein n=1 Tax=Polynucleobacter tropicus TaxID=1743174 RepID=A0A6M9PWP6_9BURK|nr:hypothetical protein [Polynucleobacter tropicus]QKM64691.1 hypothetical protein DCO17_05240 [Polynucleobacter tropicus]
MAVTKKQTLEELKQLEKKYESLVWYARKSPEQIATFPRLQDAIDRVEQQYPNETADLRSARTGDWSHGFNSGMLAATRLAQELMKFEPEVAYVNFPDLMT